MIPGLTEQAVPVELSMRWLRRGIVAITVATLVLVVLDVGGPVRAVASAVVLLVLPGLAASLLMGPMSVEFRLLASVAASAALLTLVATSMVLLDLWSPTVGFVLIALLGIGLTLLSSRGDGTTGDAAPNPDGDDDD